MRNKRSVFCIPGWALTKLTMSHKLKVIKFFIFIKLELESLWIIKKENQQKIFQIGLIYYKDIEFKRERSNMRWALFRWQLETYSKQWCSNRFFPIILFWFCSSHHVHYRALTTLSHILHDTSQKLWNRSALGDPRMNTIWFV